MSQKIGELNLVLFCVAWHPEDLFTFFLGLKMLVLNKDQTPSREIFFWHHLELPLSFLHSCAQSQ